MIQPNGTTFVGERGQAEGIDKDPFPTERKDKNEGTYENP